MPEESLTGTAACSVPIEIPGHILAIPVREYGNDLTYLSASLDRISCNV